MSMTHETEWILSQLSVNKTEGEHFFQVDDHTILHIDWEEPGLYLISIAKAAVVEK